MDDRKQRKKPPRPVAPKDDDRVPEEETPGPGASEPPTPVRLAMEGTGEETEEDPGVTRTVRDEFSGTDWVVTVVGRSSSGILPRRSVPLMELTFSRAEEPHRPLRSILRLGDDVNRLSDEDLLRALADAGPYRDPLEEPEESQKPGRSRKGRRSRRS